MNDTKTGTGLQLPGPNDLARLKDGTVDIPAFGGRLGVEWDPDARVTSAGGLAHFAAYLRSSGLFDELCEDFPINYESNNSCSKRDIVGSAVLAILLGKTRYAHINELRHDESARQLLGLGKIVSEDSVRRALKKPSEAELDAWLARHERRVYEVMLAHRYIVDIDNTVKPIYGHQEGAELGYNPAKPGRPSHNYQTFFIGRARIALGVDVRRGSEHSGRHGMPRLLSFLDSLPPERRPALVRGDVGYGTDEIMTAVEARGVRYLFKIRRSRNVKSLFKFAASSREWRDCGCGWESFETPLRLEGWAKARRVVFVRRPAEKKEPPEGKRKKAAKQGEATQAEFDFVKGMRGREWDYCALVTNEGTLDATALSQLYRDRGDCENNFDEYKNQWGWAGFTTKKLKPCRAMARLIAIVANWWNVFCRIADPSAHREAVTSRPAYMGLVGRIVESGRKRTIRLTSTHAEAKKIRAALDAVAAFLRYLDSIAEQLTREMRWHLTIVYAFRAILLPDPILKTVRLLQ